MTPKIIIEADPKAKRLSHKNSFEKIRPDHEFILVKSFQDIIDVLNREKISMIILDQNVSDAGKHRTRNRAISELKEKSEN